MLRDSKVFGYLQIPVGVVGRLDVLGRNYVEGQDRIGSAIVHFSLVPDASWRDTERHINILSSQEIKQLLLMEYKSLIHDIGYTALWSLCPTARLQAHVCSLWIKKISSLNVKCN